MFIENQKKVIVDVERKNPKKGTEENTQTCIKIEKQVDLRSEERKK